MKNNSKSNLILRFVLILLCLLLSAGTFGCANKLRVSVVSVSGAAGGESDGEGKAIKAERNELFKPSNTFRDDLAADSITVIAAGRKNVSGSYSCSFYSSYSYALLDRYENDEGFFSVIRETGEVEEYLISSALIEASKTADAVLLSEKQCRTLAREYASFLIDIYSYTESAEAYEDSRIGMIYRFSYKKPISDVNTAEEIVVEIVETGVLKYFFCNMRGEFDSIKLPSSYDSKSIGKKALACAKTASKHYLKGSSDADFEIIETERFLTRLENGMVGEIVPIKLSCKFGHSERESRLTVFVEIKQIDRDEETTDALSVLYK